MQRMNEGMRGIPADRRSQWQGDERRSRDEGAFCVCVLHGNGRINEFSFRIEFTILMPLLLSTADAFGARHNKRGAGCLYNASGILRNEREEGQNQSGERREGEQGLRKAC